MAEKEFVEQADLEEARDKVRWGRARKSHVVDEKEKELTAYHEAGHALVQIMLPDADPLHKVSIIPRGSMGGATFALPEKDRHVFTQKYLKALLALSFGGRLAEETFCHDISSGAQGDIAQATAIARKMILDWGMSGRLGPINFNSDEHQAMALEIGTKPYSDKTSEVIDEEVRALIDEACQTARTIIEGNRDVMQRLAGALMKYETLSAEEVRQIVDGKTLDKPTVGDLLDRERARSPESGPAAPPVLGPAVPPVAPEGA
jgi:cell division protease FtsH